MASRRHVLSLCKAALMALSIAAGCSFDGAEPADEARVATAQFKVTVGQGRLQMVVGESVELNATVTGSDPSSLYIVTYRSRDARVAAAATDGVITAVGRGETIVDVEATLIDSGVSSAASVVVAVGAGTLLDGGAPSSDGWNTKITVPANTTATVYIPAAHADSVKEGGEPAAKAEGVGLVGMEADHAVFQVGSGSYHFVSQ